MMQKEVIHPSPNLNVEAIDIWELTSNFIPHFIMDGIIYPC